MFGSRLFFCAIRKFHRTVFYESKSIYLKEEFIAFSISSKQLSCAQENGKLKPVKVTTKINLSNFKLRSISFNNNGLFVDRQSFKDGGGGQPKETRTIERPPFQYVKSRITYLFILQHWQPYKKIYECAPGKANENSNKESYFKVFINIVWINISLKNYAKSTIHVFITINITIKCT